MPFPYILSDILRLMTIRSFICISHEYSISVKYSTGKFPQCCAFYLLQSSAIVCTTLSICSGFARCAFMPRCQTAPHVLIEGVCRHGDNRNAPCIRSLHCTDGACRRKTIYFWHHDVHNDCVICVCRRIRKFLDCLRVVRNHGNFHAFISQQRLSDLCVQLVILGEKQVQTTNAVLLPRLPDGSRTAA